MQNKKMLLIAVTAILSITTGLFLFYNNLENQKNVEQRIEKETYENLSASINSLNCGEYLIKGLTQNKINFVYKEVQKSRSKLSDTNYQKLANHLVVIQSKFDLQNKINALFEDAVMNGSETSTQTIHEHITDELIDSIKLDKLSQSEFKFTLEKLKSEAKRQLKKVAAEKAKEQKNQDVPSEMPQFDDNQEIQLPEQPSDNNKIENNNESKSSEEDANPDTIIPEFLPPIDKPTVSKSIGNTGMVFNSSNEAEIWISNQEITIVNETYTKTYTILIFEDSDGILKWTVNSL